MSWHTVSLGDICELKYGKSLPASNRLKGNIDVFGSNGPVGHHAEALTKGPTVVVGRKGSFGEVNYSSSSCWPIDTTYYVDQTATQADLRWLYYLLRTLGLNKMNSAAAVPGLNREDAYRKRLKLPPLDEQRRIAAILDQAEELRAKRRAAIALLDQLPQAIFLEMFGDPTTNPMDWRTDKKLGDLADLVSGITKGRKVNGKDMREIPYLAVLNVQDKRLNLATIKTIEATEAEIDRYRLRKGDLLLTEGGDPDKLGRGALWNEELPEAIHQNHIFRVRVMSECLTPTYLSWLVGSAYGKSYFLRQAKQTTGIATINMGQLKAFPVLLPPICLQAEFDRRVQAVERSGMLLESAVAEFSRLLGSLQSRLFRSSCE